MSKWGDEMVMTYSKDIEFYCLNRHSNYKKRSQPGGCYTPVASLHISHSFNKHMVNLFW